MDVCEADNNSEELAQDLLTTITDQSNNISQLLISTYFNREKSKRSIRRKKKKVAEEDASDSENVKITTDVTCDLDKLRDWYKVADSYSPHFAQKNYQKAKESFTKWLSYLTAGFNLIIYGVGSKKILLEDFCNDMLSDYSHIVVDAFQPSVNTRIIFQSLDSNFSLKINVRGESLLSTAAQISSVFDKRGEDIVIVINNIDGPGLRESIQQQALSELAKCHRIHIIATTDHINATLMWNQQTLSQFKFLWINVNTMRAYREEILAGESKLLGLNAKISCSYHNAASLDVMWQSLTTNSRMILYKVANLFYSSKEPIEFFQLYRSSREDFLVSSDIALRQQLVELNDHRLISKKRLQDGNEYISMIVDEKVMTSFLEQKGMFMSDIA